MLEEVVLFAAIGFAAQLVDGALGMAYGLVATAVLVSTGTPPAIASASVHAAEVFTSGASATAHWRLGNVDGRLVRRLAIPGALGGVAGALLASILPLHIIRPAVAVWLLLMGGLILLRVVLPPSSKPPVRHVAPLGAVGGFLDAAGGGGWGPVVVSTLIGRGNIPRMAIGSANAAEFFVTLAITLAFATSIGLGLWPAVLGLVLGGVIVAPFAALVARSVPVKPLMVIVGVLLVGLSIRSLIQAFG